MASFEEMKSVAGKVDEGIKFLEKKLASPALLGFLNEDETQEQAHAILDDLLNDMDTISDFVNKCLEEITEEIHCVKKDCESVEVYKQEIQENVETMEEYAKQYGYVPPDHLFNNSSISSLSELSQEFDGIVLEDTSPILINSDVNSEQGSSAVINSVWESGVSFAPSISPNHGLNATFTTPCSMFKLRPLNFPEVLETKDCTYNDLCIVPTSSPIPVTMVKPKFNLDETGSERRYSIFNSTSLAYQGLQSRRLSKAPQLADQLKTPPEPEVSALSRRLLIRSTKRTAK